MRAARYWSRSPRRRRAERGPHDRRAGRRQRAAACSTPRSRCRCGGLIVSLLLAGLLILILSRQTAHFRALAKSSTDLVAVIDAARLPLRQRLARRQGGQARAAAARRRAARAGPRRRPRAAAQRRRDRRRPRASRSCSSTRRASGGTLEAHVTDLRSSATCAGSCSTRATSPSGCGSRPELREKASRDGFAHASSPRRSRWPTRRRRRLRGRRARDDRRRPRATPMELLLSDSSRAQPAPRRRQRRRRARRAARCASPVLVRRGPPRQRGHVRVQRGT